MFAEVLLEVHSCLCRGFHHVSHSFHGCSRYDLFQWLPEIAVADYAQRKIHVTVNKAMPIIRHLAIVLLKVLCERLDRAEAGCPAL